MTIDQISPSANRTFPEESENGTIHVLFVTLDSNQLGDDSPVPSRYEENRPILITQGLNSPIYSVPPPSSLVTSFYWNRLARSCIPSNVPFRIIVQVYKMIVFGTIIDEGASVSILSSIAWKVLGSPSLLLETQNLSGFNKGTSRPLGILPKLPITLRKKTIHLNVMVVQGPLDYNLLLGRDYIYSMEAIVSTLF